jgi:chemotaxis protein CheX
MSETAAEGAEPVDVEIREQLLEPFITATRAALAEMASTDVVVRAVCHNPGRPAVDGISVVLRLTAATEVSLVLSFPEQTATALARRILAGVSAEVDEQLTRDCVGEIGNVVAGQAKALLAGTPYHFTFSLPRVVTGVDEFRPAPELDCLMVAFNSEQGEFALRLLLKR